jgi:hypothetical protein
MTRDPHLATWYHHAPYGVYTLADAEIAVSTNPVAKLAEALDSPELRALQDLHPYRDRDRIAAVFAEVRDHLGVPVGEPPARFEEPLLQRDDGRLRRDIVAAFQPEAVTLYTEMRRLAGLDDSTSDAPSPGDAATVAEHAIVEWSRAASATDQARAAAEARLTAEVTSRVAELDREKRAAEGKVRELQVLVNELALQIQRLALGGSAVGANDRHAA